MSEWYELDEDERVKQVYKNFNIKQFWDWWSDGEEEYMEVRIKNYDLIKFLGNKYKISWSASGVYINSYIMLKKVLKEVRDKEVIWFGIQPRKRNVNKYGNMRFGGKDINVKKIKFVFIDIDRETKEDRLATNDELRQCDEMSELIIKQLGENGWNKSYIKIMSGNGVQLLIKLDIPFRVPELSFDKIETKSRLGEDVDNYFPIQTKEYNNIKKLLKDGIGKQLETFGKKVKVKIKLNADIDKTCFNLSRVGALPFSKNFKYGSFRWRALLKIEDGVNEGLSDYVFDCYTPTDTFVNHFKKIPKFETDRVNINSFFEHPLVKLLSENTFPKGGINNTLWFQIKILIRDNKIDTHNVMFFKWYEKIKLLHKRTFTLNTPEVTFSFDKRIVNNFCILNLIPPIFPLRTNDKKCMGYFDEKLINEEDLEGGVGYNLEPNNSIFMDMISLKNVCTNNKLKNINKLRDFTTACHSKYSKEQISFYIKYLFKDFLNYN